MSKIMVVDDMAVVREPIAASLRAAGFETFCASSGGEALSNVYDVKPDLMLLDLSMPSIDGLEVLRVLRSHSETAELPVILLTASSEKQKVIRARELGVRDYVLKSKFSLPELVARVKKYFPIEQPQPA